jgi:parvulin-like peptidyl-prolyl isomerase
MALVAASFFVLSGCDLGSDSSGSSGSGLVLAEVNGAPITQGEVRAALMLKGAEKLSGDNESLWRTVVEDLAERRLILQHFEKIGDSVDENRIKGLIQLIVRQYGSSGELDKVLEEEGINRDQWQKSVRETLAIEQILNREVYSKVQPSEKMMQEHYQKHAERYRVKKRWRVRQVVVGSEEEARRLRVSILAGVAFSKVASENSIGPGKDQGGDMGFFSAGDLPVEIESLIKRLKGDEVSRPVETSSGYHLFQVTERRLGGNPPYRVVRDKIRLELISEMGRKRFKIWLAALKENSVIRFHWRNLKYVAAR